MGVTKENGGASDQACPRSAVVTSSFVFVSTLELVTACRAVLHGGSLFVILAAALEMAFFLFDVFAHDVGTSHFMVVSGFSEPLVCLTHTVYTLASLDAAGYVASVMSAVFAFSFFSFSCLFYRRLGSALDKD